MRIRVVMVFVAVVMLTGGADPAGARGDDAVYGFMIFGNGEVGGRVVGVDGAPLANLDVHILSGAAAERIVKTGKDGTFKAAVTGNATSWIFVRGARITVPTLVSEGDGGIVEIREAIPPAVMPRSLAKHQVIPEYSDEAIDRNRWTRAWLLLDIDPTGSVQRLKLLVNPGLELDGIAIREGFKLRFEPARDRAGQPVSALGVWTFEWPAYYWLQEHQDGTLTRMPRDIRHVPCRGAGPTNSTYRDCSRPEMDTATSQPWVERPRK